MIWFCRIIGELWYNNFFVLLNYSVRYVYQVTRLIYNVYSFLCSMYMYYIIWCCCMNKLMCKEFNILNLEIQLIVFVLDESSALCIMCWTLPQAPAKLANMHTILKEQNNVIIRHTDDFETRNWIPTSTMTFPGFKPTIFRNTILVF